MALEDTVQKIGYSMTWLFGALTGFIVILAANYQRLGLSTDQLYNALAPAGFTTLIFSLIGLAAWISGKDVDANGI